MTTLRARRRDAKATFVKSLSRRLLRMRLACLPISAPAPTTPPAQEATVVAEKATE